MDTTPSPLARNIGRALVGAAAVWLARELGFKSGALAAALLAVMLHEIADAPVATAVATFL